MLKFPLLLLVFVGASGMPARELKLSVSKKAIEQLNQVTEKLNGLNLKKVRDTQQATGYKLQGAVKELADKVSSMMDTITKKRRDENAKKDLTSKKEIKHDNAISWVFDNLALNKRDLMNSMLMKSQKRNHERALKNAEKMVSSFDARELKNDLMLKQRGLKREQHMKEIDRLVGNLLDLKSLHERTLSPNLKGKLKKNVAIRKSIDKLYANFNWFPWNQEILQESARAVNRRDESKNSRGSLSSDLDMSDSSDFDWFPFKQDMFKKSARGVNQREQSKDNLQSLATAFDWFPFKQGLVQKSARGVNQREQSKNDHVSLNSKFDWFPWKQETLHDAVRDIKSAMKQNMPSKVISKSLPAKIMRDLDGNFAWDWKKADFYKPMFAENVKKNLDNFIDF